MSSVNNIAVILTGGTIGAVFTQHSTNVSVEAIESLQSAVKKLTHDRNLKLSFHSLPGKLSENFDTSDWMAIARKVEELRGKGFRRFLITHGTDTLPFTATALSLYYGSSDLSICLAGAFYPLEDERSDALMNLSAGFEMLTEKTPRQGAYVPFKGSGDHVTLHHALALKQMQPDSAAFNSFYDTPAGIYLPKEGIHWTGHDLPRLEASFKIVPDDVLAEAATHVAFLNIYPGLDLRAFHAMAEQMPILLVIRNYHSGTAYALDRPGSPIEFMKKFPQSAVAFAPFPSHYIDKPYDSTLRLIDEGAYVYKDIPPHKLYVMGVLGLAHGQTPHQALEPARPWLFKEPTAPRW